MVRIAKRFTLQDTRSLCRYCCRRTIEKTVAWLRHFRRLVVRYAGKYKMLLIFLKVSYLTIAIQ